MITLEQAKLFDNTLNEIYRIVSLIETLDDVRYVDYSYDGFNVIISFDCITANAEYYIAGKSDEKIIAEVAELKIESDKAELLRIEEKAKKDIAYKLEQQRLQKEERRAKYFELKAEFEDGY